MCGKIQTPVHGITPAIEEVCQIRARPIMKDGKYASISKRDFLTMAASGALLAVAGGAMAAEEGHEHHHGAARSPIVDAAEECVSSGRACISHCMESFKSGDTTLADCARSVEDMVPLCNAMAQLATSGSGHAKALGEVCTAVCEDCEKECRKHEDKHEVCKECGDACARLIEVLKAA
jgi:Cys-rich four helix bundle protein (predicted Tat secretion target)